MSTANPFANAINSAAEHEDHTQEQAMGGKLIQAGVTIGRLVSYVELGPQKQQFNGKPKPDCEVVRLTFELLHPEFNKNSGDSGEWYDKISCTVPKKFTGKAKFFKLMKQMMYGRPDITHMAQMLGEDFKITIFHLPTKDDPNKMYASLFDENYTPAIMAPFKVVEDDLGNVIEKKRIPTPAATVDLQCFIWSNPTMECWNSIYVDGTYTTKVEGKDVEKSKNVNQDKIMAGPAFKGSATEAMLSGAGQLPGQDQLAASGLGPSPEEAVQSQAKQEQPADDLADLGDKVAAQAAGEQTGTPAGGQESPAGATDAAGAGSSTGQSGADALADLGL